MTHDPVAIVRAFIEAWNRRDRQAIMSTLHPDARVQGVPGPIAQGRDAAMALVDPFLIAEEIDWRIVHAISAGPIVMTERIDRFRFAGDWVEVQAMGIFEIGPDNLIHAWRDYFDNAVFAGVLPPAGNVG